MSDTLRIAKRGTATSAPAEPAAAAASSDAIRFVISNDSPDEFGDVVVQRGLEIPDRVAALPDHDHRIEAQLGSWENFERGEHETRATLRLVPRGANKTADLIRALWENRHPVGASVFFTTTRGDREPIMRSDARGNSTQTGWRYRRGAVREVTVTPMPANSAALAVARSLGFASDDLAAMFRVSADPSLAPPAPAIAGATVAPVSVARNLGRTAMDLSDQIAAAEASAQHADDALANAAASIDGNAANAATLETLTAATNAANAAHDRVTVLRNAQSAAARRAVAQPGQQQVIDTNGQVVTPVALRPTNMPQPVQRSLAPSLIHRMPEPERPAGYRIAQLMISRASAYIDKRPLEIVAEEIFRGDAAAIAIARAATGVADSTTAGWAAELVRSDGRALLATDIAPMSVWAGLAAAGTPLRFNGAPAITVPSVSNFQTALEPAWVGEAGVIPVVKGTMTSQRITRNKLAGIIPITKELERTSDPAAVEVMRRLLRQATSNLLDRSLLDALPAVAGVRPAGLLNNVTTSAGASGGGVNALIADLKTMVAAMQTAHVGSSQVVLLVNSATALSLGLLVNPLGQVPSIINTAGGTVAGMKVISSPLVPSGYCIMVDAQYFYSAFDDVEIDVSEQATVTVADAGAAAPTQAMDNAGALGTAKQVLPDRGIHVAGGVTGAATVGAQAISLWQTWSLGIRLVWPAGYAVTMAGAVQAVTAITW